jgi:PAS domain S-box-containing protein
MPEKSPHSRRLIMPDKLEQAELFQIIINNLPVGYSVVNREGLIVEFNAAAEKITGGNH